ncbi:hypothetical protein DFJ77DRAFT_540091 [Powellomyces hirtus]|nr:hypothetical protein DFJ77DRAFT_540091 [Powellomyces hirtus]
MTDAMSERARKVEAAKLKLKQFQSAKLARKSLDQGRPQVGAAIDIETKNDRRPLGDNNATSAAGPTFVPRRPSSTRPPAPLPSSQWPENRPPTSIPDAQAVVDVQSAISDTAATNRLASISSAAHPPIPVQSDAKIGLEATLKAKQAKGGALQKEVEELRREGSERLAAEATQAGDAEAFLKTALDVGKAKLVASETEVDQLRHDMKEMRRENSAATASARAKAGTVERELNAQLAGQKAKLHSSEAENEQLWPQVEGTSDDEGAKVEDELRDALAAEREKFTAASLEISNLQRQIEELQQNAALGEAKMGGAATSVSQMQAELVDTKAKFAASEAEREWLLEDIQELKALLLVRDETEEKMRKEIDTLSTHRHETLAEVEQLQDQIAKAIADAESSQRTLEEWREKASADELVAERVAEELAALKVAYEESHVELQELKATLTAERQAAARLNENASDSEQTKHAALADSLAETQRALEELQQRQGTDIAALDAAKQEAKAAQAARATLEEDKMELMGEVERLRIAIGERERALAERAVEMQSQRRRQTDGNSVEASSCSSEYTPSQSAISNRTESRTPSPEQGVRSDSETLQRLTSLQAEHTALQSELARLRLAQADIGPLLLRTGMAPSVNETVASFQRRCDELATHVQTTEKEREQLKGEVERLKLAAWANERAEARFSEMQGELASLRESMDRERELWKGREEMMKADVSDARDEVLGYIRLLENIWNLAQDDGPPGDGEALARLSQQPRSLSRPRNAWKDGALEKAITTLVDEKRRLKESEAEAHFVIDMQHEKIETLLTAQETTSTSNTKTATPRRLSSEKNTAVLSTRAQSPNPHKYTRENFTISPNPSPQSLTNQCGTQTDPMMSFARIESIKSKLSEAGVIWKLPSHSSHGAQSPAGTPTSPHEQSAVELQARLGHLAAAHAQIQTAYTNAQAQVAALEQSLGHAKRLVVTLTTGDAPQHDEDRDADGELIEDHTVWMRRVLEKDGIIRDLELELATWKCRCEELEEIVEEWSLGSSAGTAASP